MIHDCLRRRRNTRHIPLSIFSFHSTRDTCSPNPTITINARVQCVVNPQTSDLRIESLPGSLVAVVIAAAAIL